MSTAVKEKDIVATLRADGSFNILVKCIRAADLVRTLADTDFSFTLFAPNEHAFKKLSDRGILKGLLDDKARLERVIRYHAVGAVIPSLHVGGKKMLKTLSGDTLVADTTHDFLVNNATVVRPDIRCGNGIIHEIDSVLFPAEYPVI